MFPSKDTLRPLFALLRLIDTKSHRTDLSTLLETVRDRVSSVDAYLIQRDLNRLASLFLLQGDCCRSSFWWSSSCKLPLIHQQTAKHLGGHSLRTSALACMHHAYGGNQLASV